MTFLKRIWPFLFLALITSVLFYRVIFLGNIFYAWDDAHIVAPQKYFAADQILHGHFPLWDPYVFTGIPFFADINIGVLSLPTLLYFFLPPAKSLAYLIVGTVFLIGSFQYLFLRYLKISKLGSTIGALVFAFAGTPFAYITGFSFLAVVVYIPILFYFAHRLVNEKKYIYLFFLILFQILQLLSGHPRPTYYTILFISFFILFTSNFPLRKKIMLLSVYYFFTLSLAAIQLVPLLSLFCMVIGHYQIFLLQAQAILLLLTLFHFYFPLSLELTWKEHGGVLNL